MELLELLRGDLTCREDGVRLWGRVWVVNEFWLISSRLLSKSSRRSMYPRLQEQWPSGIGSRLGENRLRVRFLVVSDIYPMFIELTISWVSSGFSVYIWLDTKIVFKKRRDQKSMDYGAYVGQ